MSPTGAANVGYYRGDDAYGIERAAAALGERLEAATGVRLERWRTSGSLTSPAEIAERVATAPLFGGGTLAVVADPAPLVTSAKDRAATVRLVEAVAPGNALAFVELGEPGRIPARLQPLRDAVAAAGGEVRELKAPREDRMAAWIEERARERNARIAPAAARELARRVGAYVREGDIDRRRMSELAVAELDKLALYRPGEEIRVEDVRALVPEAVPGSLWALVDALGERQARRALDLLERLVEATPEPVLVDRLHRRLRELIEVAGLLAAGVSIQELARRRRLHPYRAELLARQARAWTIPELTAALDGLLELDVRVKGAVGATEAQRRLLFSLWLSDLVAVR